MNGTAPLPAWAGLLVVLATTGAWAGPLHDAARAGDIDAAGRLIRDGANVDAVDPDTALTPLVEAALARQQTMVAFLIEQGAAPAGRDGKGFTALHAAAHVGDAGIVSLLLGHGVSVDDQENTSRVSPLHLAAERDHREAAQVLLRHGAALDPKAESGHTPVILAALNTHAGMVKLLREHGADCNFRSKRYSKYCMSAGK